MSIMARCDRCGAEAACTGVTISIGSTSRAALPPGWRRAGLMSTLPPFMGTKPWDLCEGCVAALTVFMAGMAIPSLAGDDAEPETEPDDEDDCEAMCSDEPEPDDGLTARVNDAGPQCAVCGDPIRWNVDPIDQPRGWVHTRPDRQGGGKLAHAASNQ